MHLRPTALPTLCLLAALAAVHGCSPAKNEAKTTKSVDPATVLPTSYQNLGKQTWSAKFIAYYPLPQTEEWGGFYADPFFPLAGWEKSSHDPKPAEFVAAIQKWQAQAVGQTSRLSEMDDEAVSRNQQEAVGAIIAMARVQSLSASPEAAISSWKSAWAIAKESVTSGPGDEGLNQSVLLWLCAQAAVDIARQQPAASTELAKALEIDLVKIAEEKAREHIVIDVVPRLKILSDGEALLSQAALILDPQGETDQADLMVAAALAADGGSFDAAASAKQAVEWTEDFVEALKKGWPAAESALQKREETLNADWKTNVTRFNPSKTFEYTPDKNKQLLPKLIAFNLIGAMDPMIESALDTQFNIDAARLTLMTQAATLKGAKPGSYNDLAIADPSFKTPLTDPLTKQPYIVDFKARTLRSSLPKISEDHILLSAMVRTGVKF